MDYIQGIAAQTENFFYSLGFGFLLGVIYDVFRTVRMIISRAKGFVFFMDFVYFALCAFLTFCFLLVVDGGKVRVYTACGEILGWSIYYFSFGSIVLKISNGIIGFFRRLFGRISKKMKRLSAAFWRKNRKILDFFKKTSRKSDKKLKYILQKRIGMVYNLYSCIKK